MAIFASFVHSLFEHFTYMATPQLSGDATVDDLGDIRLFHIKFLKNGA